MAFKHPEFLWALFLLFIPIAVHLLQFRKRKTILFPGVFRLIQALQINQSQRNLRYWILFSLRSLFLLLLIAAFAQPYVPHEKGKQQNHWVVIFDNSSSMYFPDIKGNTGFQEAQSMLQQWLKTVPTGHNFALITNQYAEGWVDAKQIRSKIATISESPNIQCLSQQLQKAHSWISKANEEGYSCNLLVISDFQSDFTAVNSLTKVPDNCHFIKVGRQKLNPPEFNFSIDTVLLRNDGTSLTAQISLHGKKDLNQIAQVKLMANGRIKSQKSIQFEPSFEVEDELPITKSIELQLNGLKLDSFAILVEGDQFLADNQLYCQFSDNKLIKVFLEPELSGYKEFYQLFKIQSERFEILNSATNADWIIQSQNLNDLNNYQGNVNRMVLLKKDASISGGITEFESRLNPDFLELPEFEGLLNGQIDEQTPMPSVIVNPNWESKLSKQFDPVIQTENKQTVLFQKNESDRIEFVWAAEWEKGLTKLRNSVWYLPLFSQLIYGSSQNSEALYSLNSGWIPFESANGISAENTFKIRSLNDTNQNWLASVQSIPSGLGINAQDWLSGAGFFELKGNGLSKQFALNFKNLEFKQSSVNQSVNQYDFWVEAGAKPIVTLGDLVSASNKGSIFDWNDWLLIGSLGLILLESIVLFNMFRTKIVNSQKQA